MLQIKKIGCVIIVILLLFSAGCGSSPNDSASDKQLTLGEAVVDSNALNPYFPYSTSFQKNYKARFFVEDESLEDEIQQEITVIFERLGAGKKGELWHIYLQPGTLENVREQAEDASADVAVNSDIGYCFITKNKIYWISEVENITEKEKTELCETGSVQDDKNAVVVCQEDSVKDSLGEEEIGNHEKINVYDDVRDYCSWDTPEHPDDIQTICELVWKKGEGLIAYQKSSILWENGIALWDGTNAESEGFLQPFDFKAETKTVSKEEVGVIGDEEYNLPRLTLEEALENVKYQLLLADWSRQNSIKYCMDITGQDLKVVIDYEEQEEEDSKIYYLPCSIYTEDGGFHTKIQLIYTQYGFARGFLSGYNGTIQSTPGQKNYTKERGCLGTGTIRIEPEEVRQFQYKPVYTEKKREILEKSQKELLRSLKWGVKWDNRAKGKYTVYVPDFFDGNRYFTVYIKYPDGTFLHHNEYLVLT